MKRTKPDSQSDSQDSTGHPEPHEPPHQPSRSASSLANPKRNRKLPTKQSYQIQLVSNPPFNPQKTLDNQVIVPGLSVHPINSPALSRSVPHPVPLSISPGHANPSAIKPILNLKTLSIKNTLDNRLPDPLPGPDVFLKRSLAILLDATNAALAVPPRSSSLSLSTLSDACQALVRSGSTACETLYCQLSSQLEIKATLIRSEFLAGLPSLPAVRAFGTADPKALVAALEAIDEDDCQQWLAKVQQAWKEWYSQLLMIRSILVHLDRTVLVRSKSMLPIWELGLDLFRNVVLGSPSDPISLSLSISISQQIALARSGPSTGHTLIQALTPLIYTAVGSSWFDVLVCRPVIKTTECFYSDEGRRLVSEVETGVLPVGGPQGYLAHITRRIQQESDMVARLFTTPDRVLNDLLLKTVVQLVETHLVRAHVDALLAHGLVRLLEVYPEAGSAESLRTLYALVTRPGESATQRVRVSFSSWIKRTGLEMVQKPAGGEEVEAKRDGAMVEQLIKFKRKLDEVVRLCFGGEREMFYAIKEAFESFINARQNRPAEMIAKFLDQKMRIGSRSMSEAEMEDCLSQVLVLFRYTQGKDIFEEFYKRDLAKRLLLAKSASIDAERNMVMKLKEECGPGFTAKLEVMFRDMEISCDLNLAYQAQKAQSSTASDGLDLSVSVLTAGSWPSSHVAEGQPVLPAYLHAHLDRFERFYCAKHLGRRLTWVHSLGMWTLLARFKGKKKELLVSTYQGLVLLVFNDVEGDEGVRLKDIVKRTGINEKETLRTLHSLSTGKHRILLKAMSTSKSNNDLKDKEEKDDEDDHGVLWKFNEGFKSEVFRVRCNVLVQLQSKESPEERESTRSKVITDRQTLLQLIIVRIMKSRKKIKHQNLVLEILDQTKERFKVESKEIKCAVESLLGREYIERTEGNMDEYRYLA